MSGRSFIERINGNGLANELVPLGTATWAISVKVYGDEGDANRLAAIAHILAALAPLYTHNSDGTELRRLTDEELFSGFFRENGAELYFSDGRPVLTNLAVTHHAVQEVASILASPHTDPAATSAVMPP